MRQSWRPLVLSAAVWVSAGVGAATAQTILVKDAPPASAIELVLNSAAVGTATADATGNATVKAKLPSTLAQTDVHIFLDVCDKSRRILFIERGLQPQAAPTGCERKEIAGWFLLRPETSMLVDAGDPPSVWLRQGPIPREWLSQEPGAGVPRRTTPRGLVVFGGGGLEKFANAVAVGCGQNTAECNGEDLKATATVGVDFWLTRFLAAEVTYLRPTNVNVSGSGTNFRFQSTLESQVLTVAAKGAIPVGPVRIYGRGGMNYHRSATTTTQTIDDVTITNADGTVTTIPGGTQVDALQTRGWSWMFGAGIEGWISPRFAVFGEAGLINLKGTDYFGGEGVLNERLTSVLVGVKIHLLGSREP